MTTETTARIVGYIVTNRKTGKVTLCKTSAGATRAVDRQDNAYGAYICSRKAVWSDAPEASQFAA